MMTLLRDHAASLMDVIAEVSGQFTLPFRVVWRETPWYWSLRETLRRPEVLRSGLDRSIALEQLAGVYASSWDAEQVASCLQYEIESMQRLCIPSFSFASMDDERPNQIPGAWIRKHPGDVLRENLEELAGSHGGEVPVPSIPGSTRPGLNIDG